MIIVELKNYSSNSKSPKTEMGMVYAIPVFDQFGLIRTDLGIVYSIGTFSSLGLAASLLGSVTTSTPSL